MVCAATGLVFAFFLIFAVIRASPGNERMQEIAGAIQEGAKAYLNRQVITISSIAVVIFILLFIFKDHPTAIGFLVGAACSFSAGFIGMRIAVLANTRTTQAATKSRTAAMRVAFNGGAVTGSARGRSGPALGRNFLHRRRQNDWATISPCAASSGWRSARV